MARSSFAFTCPSLKVEVWVRISHLCVWRTCLGDTGAKGQGGGGANHVLFPRSPSTPELSADELPDDIANEITDIPHDLELNQEDFSDVLPRLPDDLQDFDFFEGMVSILIQDHFCLVWFGFLMSFLKGK